MVTVLARLPGLKCLALPLLATCIARGLIVLVLNHGYAALVDGLVSRESILIGVAGSLLGAGAVQVFILVMQGYLSSLLAERIGHGLRAVVANGFLRAGYGSLDRFGTAEGITRLNTDTSAVTDWVRNELAPLVSEVVLFVTVLTAMLLMDWRLTTLGFGMLPVLVIGSHLLSKPITALEKGRNGAVAGFNTLVKGTVDAFAIMKVHNMEKYLLNEADKRIMESIRSEERANSIRAYLMSINGFVSYIPLVVLFGVGGGLVIKGDFTAGELLAFINMAGFIRGPLMNLPARMDAFRTASANSSRLLELPTVLDGPVRVSAECRIDTGADNAVEFRGVSVSYDSGAPAVGNLDLRIKNGSKTVIIGESGCGKSTVLKLIAGLYPPDRGEVTVFGADTRRADPAEIRAFMAYVPQEPQLFPVGILENITCGHPIDPDAVSWACESARLTDLIARLPDGIHTNTGECGNRLSGGERQRICIARALARRAPLLLLDEAVSALDAATGNGVMGVIDGLAGQVTIVLVTHDTRCAVNADRIICMRNGRIIETGNHGELMGTNGYYANLFRIQNDCTAA